MGLFDKINIGAMKDALGSGVKAAQEGISNIKVDEIVQGARDAAASGAAMVGDAVGNVMQGGQKPEEVAEPSPQKAVLSILWYLSSVDGEITDAERGKLAEMAAELDENYASYAEELEKECKEKLAQASKDFGVQSGAKVEAQRVLEALDLTVQDARLICWDLLALAGSDGLDKVELDFIRFVSEKAGVASDVFEELRNYNDAILEIDKSMATLRASDRSYAVIEPLISEYAKREQFLIQAAQSLITDR